VINEVFSSHPDLSDQRLSRPDLKLFTDGSSFLKKGTTYAGYAVETLDSVLEAQALAPGTSVQKAEFTALMHTLQLAAERAVTTYTD
jgi:ribonuclease HI